MATSTCKNHDFKCSNCAYEYKKLMWTNKSIPEGTNCPECDHHNMPREAPVKQTSAGIIGENDKWANKIDSDFKFRMKQIKQGNPRSNIPDY